MLTEQKPPCAAQLGVPNCCAHSPDSACIWSRPVKNASCVGLVERIFAEPRRQRCRAPRPIRFRRSSPRPRAAPACAATACAGCAGEYCFMMPAEPLAQSTPWLTGWLRLPWMKRTLAVLDGHLDAAAARAHVAGRVMRLLRGVVLARQRAVFRRGSRRASAVHSSAAAAALCPTDPSGSSATRRRYSRRLVAAERRARNARAAPPRRARRPA